MSIRSGNVTLDSNGTAITRALALLEEALPVRGTRAVRARAGSVARVETILGRELPADLKGLWGGPPLGPIVESEALKGVLSERDDWWLTQRWLTPAEAGAALRELRQVKVFPRTLVPIATDDAGNYTCQDAEKGKLVDWDHETRKARRLPGSLSTVVTELAKLVKAEAKLAEAKLEEKKSRPSPLAPAAAVPRVIRPLKSPFLRKLVAPLGKHGSLRTAALAPDGDLVIAVSDSRSVLLGSLRDEREVVPAEPTIQRQKKEMGFVRLTGEALAFAPDGVLLWRDKNDLRLWRWASSTLELAACGRWTGGMHEDFPYVDFDEVPPCITASRFGFVARKTTTVCKDDVLPEYDTRVVSLWDRESLSPARVLKDPPKEHEPSIMLPLVETSGDVHFDIAASGSTVVAESLGYMEVSLSVWDANGKRLAEASLNDCDIVAIRKLPDESIVALTAEGNILALDPKLHVTRKVRAHKERGGQLRLASSGAFLVSSAEHEIAVWNAKDLSELARVKVKEATHGFGVHALSEGVALTIAPFALFALS